MEFVSLRELDVFATIIIIGKVMGNSKNKNKKKINNSIKI